MMNLFEDLTLEKHKDSWEFARRYPKMGKLIMEFIMPDFSQLSEKEQRLLIKFSTPWDLQKILNEEISVKKFVDMIRRCLQQKVAQERKDRKSSNYQIETPLENLSIKLDFMKNSKKKNRSGFKLTEDMIAILKSDLNTSGAAKIAAGGWFQINVFRKKMKFAVINFQNLEFFILNLRKGISFRKIAKLIHAGAKMTQLNRLFFNKTLSVEQTVNIIQGKDANETLDKMASVGNAKIFYDALKNEENFITISQGIMVLGKFIRK